METIERFREIYCKAIDNNGNPRLCGRETCKELIEIAEKIEDNNYGNKGTGIMNINTLVNLMNKLNKMH